jgi:hypothetical protein
MRRLLLLVALLAALPATAEAQPRLMVGGGVSAPSGDFSDIAEAGYHVKVAMQVGIPTLPVGLRGDGVLHRFGTADAAFADSEVLTGALSLVFTLPGVGLEPYFLAGVGTYRVETGPAGAPLQGTDRGYHGGFGVVLGGLGLGAFAEVRYVQISGDLATTRLIPLTLGLRF